MAEIIANHIVENKLDTCLEYTERSKSFKLKLLLTDLPIDVSKAVKIVTKETTTQLAGKLGVKVRMLSVKLLKQELVDALKALHESHKFSDWVEKMLVKQHEKKKKLAEEFYRQV